MSVERTDFVDVLPLNSLKTLLSLVKGGAVSSRETGLAVENVSSYAMGQFLPTEMPPFPPGPLMMASAPPTREACIAALEAVMPDASGTMKAGPVGKLDWATILKTVLPFIISLLV